ncbi:unnamed protein product [Orchesella dallaii]|uniref:Cytochrome P450 4C1 n=1 Tax=Orchesella dallaii TaxID=48710 RepID=A0ABP1RMI2_9HEXA
MQGLNLTLVDQSLNYLGDEFNVTLLLSILILLLFVVMKLHRKHFVSASIKNENELFASCESKDPYNTYKSLPGPTPFPLRLIGNSLSFFSNINIPQKLFQFAKKYGPYYRLTFLNEDYVVLNTPSAAEALLGSTNVKHFHRSRLQETLWPTELEQSIIILPGGEEWKKKRKMLSRAFMTLALQRHNSCWHKQCERMVEKLEERFQDEGKKDNIVADILKQCTFAMSSETLMGVDITQEAEDGALFCESLDEFNRILFGRIFRPWLLVDWIWRRSSEYRKARAVVDGMEKVTHLVIEKYKEKFLLESVEERNANDELKHTMIETMMRNGIDEKAIFDETITLLAVATDATSLAEHYALFLLALNPEHQELCRQEIDKVFEDPKNVKNGILEFEALKALNYLERCILESLRIYPLTIILRRLEAPLKIDENLVIPKDVSVIVTPYVLHNLPECYPNPENFDPDRFLPENVKERHPYAYLSFSAGPRNCMGIKFGMIEVKVVLATILRNFVVSTPDTMDDVKLVVDGAVNPAAPMRFNLSKR